MSDFDRGLFVSSLINNKNKNDWLIRKERITTRTMNQNQNQPLALPEIVPDSDGTQHDLGALLLEIVTDSEFTPRQLGALMAFCHQHVPTPDVAFVEGVCVIAAYVKMGLIDLHDVNHVNNFKLSSIEYKTNHRGRITKLVIHPNRIAEDLGGVGDEHDDYVPYHLSKDILRLRKLEDLRVASSSCGIPDDCDLAALPHLKVLGLYGNHYTSARIVPSNMKLPRLEKFIIAWWDLRLSPSTNVLPWMTHQLPNLKHLIFRRIRSGAIEPFLEALNNNTVCFQESLEKISFKYCELTKTVGVFTKMTKSVLPRFVRLDAIVLFDEGIKNFKFLSTVTATIPLPRTIHTFLVWPYKFHQRTAILNFLETNNCVYNLMGNLQDYREIKYRDYHPDLKYPLLINHAGRSMIDNGESKDNHKEKKSRSSITPSLLPKLLARSYHHSDDIYPVDSPFHGTKDHTGVYYLLRNSIPALIVTLDMTMDN